MFQISQPSRGEEMEGETSSGTQVNTKVLENFQKSFFQVQNILDQNRVLIDEINRNQESKIPDNLCRNVGLIKELNNNIRRVVDVYADLSGTVTKSVEASPKGPGGKAVHNKRFRPG